MVTAGPVHWDIYYNPTNNTIIMYINIYIASTLFLSIREKHVKLNRSQKSENKAMSEWWWIVLFNWSIQGEGTFQLIFNKFPAESLGLW